MADIIRRGITIAEAYQEAAATALVSRVMLATYELWHPSLFAPIRFVNDLSPLTATLEATAPRDASTSVIFMACPLNRTVPEESDSAASPSIVISRPDVGGILQEAADTYRGSLDTWSLIERIYASDDTSEPALNPPLTFEVVSFDIAFDGSASLSARYGDWANVAVPRTTFKRSEYPGLQR